MINLFAVPATDQSLGYLGQIFGTVGVALSGTGPVLLPKMYLAFNTALLVLGTILVAYVTVAGVLKTAQEGEMMGKHWNSFWLPLRMLMGIAGLIPTSNGYCAIQVIMMWIIVQGVGAADTVWTAAINYFGAGGGGLFNGGPPATSFQDSGGTLPKVMEGLFQNVVCQAAATKAFAPNGGNANALATTAPPQPNTPTNPTKYTFYFGNPNDTTNYYAGKECGWLTLSGATDDTSVPSASLAAQLQAIQTILPALELAANYYVNSIIADSSCWTSNCNTQANPAPCSIFNKYDSYPSNGNYCTELPQASGSDSTASLAQTLLAGGIENFVYDATTLFYGAAKNYTTVANLSTSAQQQTAKTADLGNAYTQAQNLGWLFAGTYYYYIASQNNSGSDTYDNFVKGITVTGLAGTSSQPQTLPASSNNLPSTSPPTPNDFYPINAAPPGGISGQLAKFVLDASNTANNLAISLTNIANKAVQTTGGLVVSGGSGIPSEASAAIGPLADLAIQISNNFISLITPNSAVDPLVAIHNFGHSLLIDADILFITFFSVGIALGFASTVIVWFGNTVNYLEGIAKFIISYILPIALFFMGYLIVIGGLLGIYLPLLPFTLFTLGAIGWFLSVVEAMTAAPIIAIGMMMPGGQHEIMGRAEHAIMITLNIFLRPTLMVFGMMAAMLLGYVLMEFVGGAFSLVLSNMATGLGVIEAFLYLIAYTYLVITVLNKCYELIFFLPKNVITWVGGHGSDYGEAGMASEVKGGVSAGAGAAKGAAAGATSGAMKNAAGIDKKATEKTEKNKADGKKLNNNADAKAGGDGGGGGAAGGGAGGGGGA